MTFDLEKIWQSKRAMRHALAGLPIAEKLAMLDRLRERALTIRASRNEVKTEGDNVGLTTKSGL